MRLEWGTLDARPIEDFERYVRETHEAHRTGEIPVETSERLARSMGL
jgi:hypothetical protein